MSETPKVGDKVRLTLDGSVCRSDGGDVQVRLNDLWGTYTVPLGSPEMEILERADDPASDPIGTVRRSGDGLYAGESYVKTAYPEYPWVSLSRGHEDGDSWRLSGNGDRYVVGWPIIGAVPGTPAAASAESVKTEWTVGDDEPPHDGKYEDRDGDIWQYGVSKSGAHGWYFDYSASAWSELSVDHDDYFPWKRVG
jgi:hypothetical protein